MVKRKPAELVVRQPLHLSAPSQLHESIVSLPLHPRRDGFSIRSFNSRQGQLRLSSLPGKVAAYPFYVARSFCNTVD
jgi:hypothetical protein